MAGTKQRVLTNLDRLDRQPNLDPRVRSVALTLREILEAPEDTTNEEKQEILAECLDVDTLTHPAVSGMTHLCRQIKDVMTLVGLPPSDNRRVRLPIRIAHGLFEREMVTAVEAALTNPRAGHGDEHGISTRDPAIPRIQPAESSSFAIVKAISSRYSDSTKYNGQLDDDSAISFNIFRASYMTAMEELGAPREQRASLIHHALKGPALDFYHESIHGKVTQVGEVFLALEEKFLSESIKLGIRTKLLSLRLSEMQRKENLTKLEAIEIAKRQIYNLSQQGQNEYRSDTAMIDIIEKSVLQGEQWSVEIAARRATQKFSFDEYCTALTTWIRATVEKSGIRNGTVISGSPVRSNPWTCPTSW
jgi:hypothetical protein